MTEHLVNQFNLEVLIGRYPTMVWLPYQGVYAATKAFVLHFSESLSGELLNSEVHVMALCPGLTRTNYAKTAKADTRNMRLSTSSDVVDTALAAFARRRHYVIPGLINYLTSLIPRITSRHQTIRIVVGMFKERVQ